MLLTYYIHIITNFFLNKSETFKQKVHVTLRRILLRFFSSVGSLCVRSIICQYVCIDLLVSLLCLVCFLPYNTF